MSSGLGSAGVTFIEVILVVVLVGILSAAAMPSFRNMYARMEVSSAANAIRVRLLMARARAIADVNNHCGVHFDKDGKWFRAFIDTAGTANKFDEGSEGTYMERSDLSRKVAWEGDVLDNANSAVVFRGDGSAASGQGTRIRVTHATNSSVPAKVIDLLPSTGRVRAQWE